MGRLGFMDLRLLNKQVTDWERISLDKMNLEA